MNQNDDLSKTIKEIQKTYQQSRIAWLNDNTEEWEIATISSGSLLLDEALGGGYPCGRIAEIYGPEGSGKTTLALQAISALHADKQDEIAVFLDVEQTFNLQYAKALRVDPQKLIVVQPQTAESALDILERFVATQKVKLIVLDSVAALLPESETKAKYTDSTIGLQARLMSKALRRLIPLIQKANCVVLFLNQIRMKVNTMFGNPETTSGGRALQFYASIRVDVRRIETIKNDQQVAIGNKVRLKVTKNKIGPPLRSVETIFSYQSGLNHSIEKLQIALNQKTIVQKGSWYYYNKEQIGQGKQQALAWLEKNQNQWQKLKKQPTKQQFAVMAN